VILSDLRTLPAMDVSGRAGRLRARLDGAGCDALVVSHLTNVRYLSGFAGTNGTIVLTPDGLTLVTDPRYDLRATDELAAAGVDASLVIARTGDEHRDALRSALVGVTRVGLEADHVSWADQRRYAEDRLPEVELVPTTGLVEDLRAVKDTGEVARIEAAAGIADAALAATRHLIEEPDGELPTEAGFAAALDAEVRRLGAADVSFPTIVAAGPNGARPHHEPGDRSIEPGDLVICDFGALVDGYHSDMTRTIVAGGLERLDDERARMLEVVTAAQAAGVAAVRAGRDASEIDAACREVIAEAGWADAFVHGTGHGVGLDIHEAPRVSTAPGATLLDGHVVTVEPGVYLPGLGGVRVEDTVVVTPTGHRTLTRAPKVRIRPNA
jgi:Xaa-Pro aminopeptidase